MMNYNDLVSLLKKYGLDGKKLIKNNKNILDYAIYSNVEDIIIFLQDIGIPAKNIEKCPSILTMKSMKEIEDNYNFLIEKTEIEHIHIEDCLHILNSDLEEMGKIYEFVSNKYGVDVLKKTPSILSGEYDVIESLTNTLENTIGLDIVKNNGGTILINTNSVELNDILTIPIFGYDSNTKKYNKDLLTATTFFRSYSEICDILKLPYWKVEKYKPLLTSTVWMKDANQIQDILELPYWQEKKYEPLLTSTVWMKDANQIQDILKLPDWQEKKYEPLLTPTVWLKEANQIQDILKLSYWQEKKYEPLLTPSVWFKDANQIKDILELPYWQEKKYECLLVSSMWQKSATQIETNIQICLNNGLETQANNPTLIFRLTANELQAKINYLNYHKIPLINDKGKICNIFGMSNKNMQKNYGISKKELVRDYLTMEVEKHVL